MSGDDFGVGPSAAGPLAAGDFIVDLTMPIREGIAAYASHGRSVLELSRVMKHSDFAGKGRFNVYDGSPVSFEVSQWLLGDQTGTHMDAPFHADADSLLTIEAVPLTYAFGPAVWVDCPSAVAAAGISVGAIRRGLADARTELLAGDILLLRTGASDRAGTDPTGYAATAAGLTREAAEWLRHAGVKTVGIDCVTIESAASAPNADVHINFLKPSALGLPADDIIAVIENVMHIDSIPAHRFTFYGFPLPLVGAAGSPLRAVAVAAL